MTQFESIAFTGPLFGPILQLPEGYKPKVLISDEEYEAICVKLEKGEKLSNADKFFGRDYVVDQFLRSSADGLVGMTEERLANLFAGVKSCSCCWRHCHNAPSTYDSCEDRSHLATAEMVSDRNCHCHCRMTRRAIRRAFFTKRAGGHLE